MFETGNVDDEEFARDLQDDATRFLWGDYTVDELLDIGLHADEVPGVEAGSGGPSTVAPSRSPATCGGRITRSSTSPTSVPA